MRPSRAAFGLIGITAVLVLALAALALPENSPAPIRYYPETNQLVREPFLSAYVEMGGSDLLGYPLTAAYPLEDGSLAQTFERGQLQLTVRGVVLASLGTQLALGTPGGAVVDPAFSAYYEQYGGEGLFGLPLGIAVVEHGILAQNFENARFIRNAVGDIYLADLGRAYLTVNPPVETASGQASFRVPGDVSGNPVLKPKVSVARPTIGVNDRQTLYVVVSDSQGNPLEGVRALAVLRYNNGVAEVEFSPTNEQGLATVAFVAPPAAPGSQVLVEIHLLYGEVFHTLQTSYIQWW